MALSGSGKQLSFEYGEVDPSLRFKSDEAAFALGLSKLTNMGVRKTGGVSNRSGLKLVKICESQLLIPEAGGNPGVKSFVFWNEVTDVWETLTYAKYAGGFAFTKNGVLPASPTYYDGPKPHEIRYTMLKDRVLITPPMDPLGSGVGVEFNHNICILPDALSPHGFYNVTIGGDEFPSGTGTSSHGYAGATPFLPVSYIVMALMDDGTERFVLESKTVGYVNTTTVPTGGPLHPHAQMTAKIEFTLPAPVSSVKSFNFYRASGDKGIGKSFYRLAGRVPYDVNTTNIVFTDYGVEVGADTPPIDTGWLLKSGITSQFMLTKAVAAAYYQQRLICTMLINGDVPTGFKAGDIIASKIGAPTQLKAPIIFSDLGAFQFSIPIDDGTNAHALLGMERLIAFTERGVYVIRGGDQGILTPTQVNPLRISDEGCSKTVEPTMAGRRGYFINNTHSKLMAIEFGPDGNLTVFEASRFSGHLFRQKVLQIVTLGGGEDTVYALRADGKLVRVTCGETGAHGFATMETDGYVESIFRGKAKKVHIPNVTEGDDIFHDVLMCYVIRNGVRTLEELVVREDRHREGEFFADCHTRVGWRLKYLNLTKGWDRVDKDSRSYGGPINFTTATTWVAGQTITMAMDTTAENPFEASGVIHTYYLDSEGNERLIRFTPNWATKVEVVGSMTVQGTFAEDVPAYLQNVANNAALSASEKILRRTKWLSAFNRFPLFTYNGQILKDETPLTVVMDGEVLSSPLNPNKPTVLTPTLVTGQWVIDLDDYYSWGYVGLPYTSVFETQDLETSDNRTLTEETKLVNRVDAGVMETRGGFFGLPDKALSEMEEVSVRTDNNYLVETVNYNGLLPVHIPTEYTSHGRIAIKNVDPVPMTILSVYPKGIAGG